MKIPTLPPTQAAFERIQSQPDRLAKAYSLVRNPLVNGKYLHWDKLRHLKPPEDLNHEEWWAGIKIARSADRKALPIVGTDGEPFSYIVVDPVLEAIEQISRNAGRAIQMPDPLVDRDHAERYIVRSLIEEAITSSQIEGAATTRRVAKQMIRSGRPPRDKSEMMIVNNYTAMRFIKSLPRDEPLTERLLLELHRVLVEGTVDNPDEAGRLRGGHERIVVADPYGEELHEPPPADELPARLAAMIDFANGGDVGYYISPVVRSMILHFWLAYDHPFTDGNGRCARALFYWSMLRHGYWLCEFVSISEVIKETHAQYGRAYLHAETDGNDLTYFLVYHVELIERAIEKLHAYIRRKTKETRSVERRIRSSIDLNHRQKALLSHALRHPDATYTIQSHQVSHDVVYQTARNDLHDLADKELLDRGKSGKTYVFHPATGLADRLEA